MRSAGRIGGAYDASDGGTVDRGGRARWLGAGVVALAGAGFGLQSILAKVAYDGGADVATLLAVRFGVASLLLWTIVAARSRRDPARGVGIDRERWSGFAALGLLFVASALLAYLALERLAAGTTTLLVFLFPALVVLWSRLLFGERLTRHRAAALALALTGCLLTLIPADAVASEAALSGIGVAFALGSALSNSIYATIAGPITRGVPGLTAAAASVPVTAACFLVGLAVLGGPPVGITAVGWLACGAIGVLLAGSTAAFLTGVSLIGPSRAAITATSEPATAVVLGVLLLGEPLTAFGLIGGLLIVAAIVLLALAPVARRDDDAVSDGRLPSRTASTPVRS